MTVPYTFGTATTSIPLSNLDSNFNTPITLGNTSIYLGNTTTTIGNLTLTNVTISSGSANITSNITYATANAVVYTNSSNVGITSTSLTFNGTNLGVGNANPQALLHVGSVVEAPGFGTTSQMTYINGTSQPELLIRETTNDVVVSMYADSTSGSIRTATNHPLIFFTNNTDRMRITNAGNVGIGTSSPVAPLNVVGQTTSTSTPILYLQQGGSAPGYGYAFKIDNQTTGNLFLNRYGANTNTDLGTLLTVTGDGNVGIGVTPACILDISGASGGQIKFPATQNASSNANTLDDYEEGTWTPTQGSGLTVVGAFSSSGRYVKIGKTVMLIGEVAGATTVALSSNGELCGGLPFTAAISPYALALLNCANTKSGAGLCLGTNISECSAMTASANIKFTITYFV